MTQTANLTVRIVAALLAVVMVLANVAQQSPGVLAAVLPPHVVSVINLVVPLVLAVGHELLHQFPALSAPPPPAAPATPPGASQ